jgi:hypothetical protein
MVTVRGQDTAGFRFPEGETELSSDRANPAVAAASRVY